MLRRRSSQSTSSLNRLSAGMSTSSSRLCTNNNDANRKKTLKKPEWDSTVNDLNQLKPSKDELIRRKESLKSKNADLVKFEKQKQEILKSAKKNQGKLNDKTQLALLKEILYDDEQLKNLLHKSDSTLKLVKHLFNDNDAHDDDARSVCSNSLKQAKINLTLAPNVTDLNDSNLPNDLMTSKEKTSGNVHTARVNFANEVSSSSKQINLENMNEINKLADDLEKYKKLLSLKQALADDENQQSRLNELNLREINECLTLINQKKDTTQHRSLSNQNEVKNVNQQSNFDQSASFNHTGQSFSDEIKRALFELESKLNDFERHLGKKINPDCFTTGSNFKSNGSFSAGYNLTMIKIMSSLMDYLKETMVELNYEKLKQVELNKQLDLHRKLIDGLTTEILCVKEQNEKIINDHLNHNAKLEAELDQIKMWIMSVSYNETMQMSQMPPPQIIDPKFQQIKYVYKPNVLKPTFNDQENRSNANNDQNVDLFSERLNNMLHIEKSTSLGQLNQSQNQYVFNQNRPFSANNYIPMANYPSDLMNNPYNKATINHSSVSPLGSGSNSGSFTNKNTNNALINSQINELKLKNAQTEQRLRQLQSEQFKSNENSMRSASHQSLNEQQQNADLKQKKEALEKLKQEQKLLRDQINKLNKERETTNQELEVLSLNDVTSSSESSQSKTSNSKLIQKQLAGSDHLRDLSNQLDCNSPNLSPISSKNFAREVKKK